MRKVRALLVGINDYPTLPKLHGCLNDVDHMRDWLRANVREGLALEVLKNADATRENVIAQFRQHLQLAEAGDAVLFHYCGHGGQTYSAPEFKATEPDGLDEGLVLWDSRRNGVWDLADKELALLIRDVAQPGVEVVFALDSCHSGSGTRDIDEFDGLVARLAGRSRGTRPLDSYLDGEYARWHLEGKSLRPEFGRHILLAACDKSQTAKETADKSAGVFTTALVEVLQQRSGQLSYRDLYLRCQAAVRSRAIKQDPSFECIGGFDGGGGFLGGHAGRAALRHRVSFNATEEVWTLNAGAAEGLGDGTQRPVELALYHESDLSHPVRTARTTEISLQHAEVSLDGDGDEPSRLTQFVAAVTSMPTAPLLVHCPEDRWRDAWQTALDGEGAVLGAGGAVLCEKPRGTRYALVADAGELQLRHPGPADLRLAVPLDPGRPVAAARALQQALRSIVQWERLQALKNRHSDIDPADIEFACEEMEDGDNPGVKHRHTGEALRFDAVCIKNKKGEDQWFAARVRFTAQWRKPIPGQSLHVAMLHFTSKYGIKVHPEGGTELAEGPVVLTKVLNLNCDVDPSTKTPLETEVRVKLLVSTRRIETSLLEQDNLSPQSLIAKRDLEDPEEDKKRPSREWRAVDMRLRVVPRGGRISADQNCPLAGGKIVIRKHPRLTAQARLAPIGSNTRGLGDEAPFLAAFEEAGLGPLGLGDGERSAEAQALELSGIENADDLGGQALEIEVHAGLESDEALQSFTHDGMHLLPVGRVQPLPGGGQLLSIPQVPSVASSDGRSVGGALKLYFFKTRLKMDRVQTLARADFSSGSFRYVDDDLPDCVAQPGRILLLVHGIIGDTQGMAEAVHAAGLDQGFDHVLTFDYENLNTPIDDTARRLKRELASIGLAGRPGDKKITVLAHSMGGLVSRWFVEQEGGDAVVEHLVMCGTPNRGSPFSKLDQMAHWLDFLKGLAANLMPQQLSPLAKIAKQVLEGFSFADVTKTLEQMHPASTFIRTLNSGDDPGVRYTILAGNVREYQPPVSARFPELLDKLGKAHAFGLLFDDKPHDIAVAQDSILRVSARRQQPTEVHPLTCHHLNYFTSEVGQQALRQALGPT